MDARWGKSLTMQPDHSQHQAHSTKSEVPDLGFTSDQIQAHHRFQKIAEDDLRRTQRKRAMNRQEQVCEDGLEESLRKRETLLASQYMYYPQGIAGNHAERYDLEESVWKIPLFTASNMLGDDVERHRLDGLSLTAPPQMKRKRSAQSQMLGADLLAESGASSFPDPKEEDQSPTTFVKAAVERPFLPVGQQYSTDSQERHRVQSMAQMHAIAVQQQRHEKLMERRKLQTVQAMQSSAMDLSERGDLTIPAQLYSTEGSERLNIERDGCRLHDPRRVRHTSDGKSVSGTRVFSFREDHTPLELSKYFYSPLPSESSIRLLRVEPGVPNDRLRCSLVAVEVEGSQEYEAVSYAWGVTSQIIQLQCDGKALDISRNLDDALHRLRNPAQARYVWADAVCINQRDLLERQRQVAMMRKIYKNASQVLIWIGRDKHDEAASAFSLATDIATTKGGAVSMVSPRHPDWKCIASLFSRPWFGRLWVVQEITLARRATIFWGDSELEWQELGFVAACIRTLGYQVMQQNPMPGVYNAYLMYRLTQDKESASVFFLRLLTMTRQFQCTDQRDRVYGLLGLPSTDGDPEKGEIFVQPDYTMSRLEVYSTVAAKILRRTDNLFLLSAVQHGPEIATELPSWIPQWDRVFTHTLIPADHSGKMHCASGDVPRQILRPITPTSPLLLRGLLIDTVSTISPVIPGRADTFQTIIELYNIFKGMVSPLLTYPSGHALEQAFCNVLCAGKDWYGEIVSTAAENEAAERQHLADFFAFWRTMLMLPIPPWYLALSEQGDTNRCWEAVLNGVGGRRFFVTQKGYIGIGPPCSAVGDTVVVLFGGTVPFLLRKIGQGQWKDSMWKLVGETYVAGLMHGESIEKMNNGLASEDFTIT